MAVKPAVGMFDFASKTTEGLRNFTRVDILSQELDAGRQGRDGRIRPPRAFGVVGELREYDLEEALAQQVLHSVLQGRCRREHVVAQFAVQGWPHGLNALERDEAKYLAARKHDVAAVLAETLVRSLTVCGGLELVRRCMPRKDLTMHALSSSLLLQARDDLVPSRQVDMGPLFSPESATAQTLELASIPENHLPMLLLLSEARLLLIAGTYACAHAQQVV